MAIRASIVQRHQATARNQNERVLLSGTNEPTTNVALKKKCEKVPFVFGVNIGSVLQNQLHDTRPVVTSRQMQRG